MRERGFVYFDAHFENILTDGESLYFSDLGLAVSDKFELTPDEIAFMAMHDNYDQSRSVTSLVHCIVTNLPGDGPWHQRVEPLQRGTEGKLSPAAKGTLRRYAEVAVLMREFSQKLIHENRLMPYPRQLLDDLLHVSFD